MQLTVVGSSSSGNCYILESGLGEVLLLECGLKFDKILKALNYSVTRVIGCLVTHEHGDHCLGAEDVAAAGINIYASAGTIEAFSGRVPAHRLKPVAHHVPLSIGMFRIMPFKVMHDAREPLGFLLWHEEMGTTLFLTDSYYSVYTFEGLNNLLVEANYCEKILQRKLEAGANKFVRDRVIQSHMSFQTCLRLLEANDLRAVNNIVLIHLSDSNSHADDFQRQAKEKTGKTVHVASPGLSISFNKTPF